MANIWQKMEKSLFNLGWTHFSYWYLWSQKPVFREPVYHYVIVPNCSAVPDIMNNFLSILIKLFYDLGLISCNYFSSFKSVTKRIFMLFKSFHDVYNVMKKDSRPAHYVWFSWFWSHLKMSKNVFCVVARLPQRLKSMFFEIFSSLRWPLRDSFVRKFSKNIDFSLWGKQCIVPRKWDQNCENHT